MDANNETRLKEPARGFLMSKRSERYTIFGKTIRVFYKIGPLNKEDTLRGYYDPENKVIYIDARQSRQEQLQTTIHELVHGLVDRLGFHQTNFDHNLEELLCENVAEMLLENFNISKKSFKP